MNRFWIFPLVLTIVGTLFSVLAPLEGIAPFLSLMMASSPRAVDVTIGSVPTAMVWGASVGTLCGLVAGGCNLLRPKRESSCRAPLASNMVWCLFYAHGFIIGDMALVFWWVSRGTSGISLAALTAWLPGLFWIVAIFWATVRTIATEDILTPRVLTGKLRRSARVEG